ncbi:MAG: hypothetical protein ACJ72D_04260 [Marmoricola sp.]
MSTVRNLARFAAAAILATGVLAGGSGPAGAAVAGHHQRIVVSTGTDSGAVGGGFTTNRLSDTGWG